MYSVMQESVFPFIKNLHADKDSACKAHKDLRKDTAGAVTSSSGPMPGCPRRRRGLPGRAMAVRMTYVLRQRADGFSLDDKRVEVTETAFPTCGPVP